MPKLGDSQEFKDIANSLRDIASEAKNADMAVDELGDGVKEALQAMQKLGIIKNALKPTEQAVEAARQAFAEFNSELGDDYESVTQLIRADKDFQKYLRGVVGETEALSNAQKKHKKATKEDTAAVKVLGENIKNVLEQVQALKKAMDTGGINVKINNAGFTKVLDEMARAVDNFKRRKGNAGKNFFDAFTGSREENLETSQRVITDAKTLTDKLENVLGDSLTETLSKKLKDSISTGILKGVEMGVSRVQEIDPTAKLVGALLDETNASQPTKARVLQTMLGKKDETAIALERVKQNAKARIQYRQIEADRQVAVDKQIAAMRYIDANPNSNQARYWKAHADKEELSVEKERRALAAEDEKKQRDETNRIRNMREAVRIQKEMNEVVGEEGSKLQKLGQDLVSLNAKRREYLIQGDELNKINFAEVANNQRLITKKTQEWAAEAYKVEHHYYQIEKVGKALVNTLKFLSSTFQTTSATLSSLGGIWSTMRTSATQFFTFFTNSFRRVFSQAKSMALSLFKSGLEQRKKIEQAQIGFASFFGEDRVDAVTQAVRREAAKTPIVNAGDLADYVMQLAPVSQGNASLALNSSLGILKSLVYSGSDISEGEYVIKNIRDVIAKGTATAIDIRQFNRALPGLETALKKMPDLANFIDKNGKLSITKQNVGQVLDVFAKLNTDENSPLKQIEEKMLHTLDGMEKLFNEKKTTAMETILEKSGVFDLLYKALGLATDDGLWKKIADFVGNSLQPIVGKLSDILTNTDWGKIGKKLQEFWAIVKSGITDAKEAILGAGKEVLGDDPEPMFKRIASIIASLIRGIGNGIAEAMRFAKWLANMLSGGDLEKLAENIGKWLISPLGKIVQTIIGLGANSFGAASRALSTMSKFIEMFNKLVLGRIAKNAIGYGQAYANMYASGDAFGNTMATNMLLNGAGRAKTSGTTSMKIIGGGTAITSKVSKISTMLSSIKGIISKGFTTFTGAGITTLIAQGIKKWTGAGDNNLVGMLSNGVTGAAWGGAIGTFLASTLGIIGGPLGAMIGGVLSVVIPSVQELGREAAERRAARTEAVNTQLEKDQQEWADRIVELYKSNGGTIDEGTDEGRYIMDQFKAWVKTLDDSELVEGSSRTLEGLAKLANSDYFSHMSERLAKLDDSEAWKNAYSDGSRIISDWDAAENRDMRHKLYEMAKEYRLLGEDYAYEDKYTTVTDDKGKQTEKLVERAATEETLVRDLLSGQNGGISESQYQLYMAEYEKASSDIGTNTLNVYNTIKDNLAPKVSSMDQTLSGIYNLAGAIAAKMGTNGLDNKNAQNSKERFDKLFKTGGDLKTALDVNLPGFITSGPLSSDPNLSLQMRRQNVSDATKDTDLYKNPSWSKLYSILQNKLQSTINQGVGAKARMEASGKWNDNDLEWMTANLHLDQIQNLANELSALPNTAEAYAKFLEKIVSQYSWLLKYAGGQITVHSRRTRPIYRATGGEMGVDTVPAMLQPGEFVMRKAAVAKAGLGTMFALNRGDMAAAARSLGARFSGNYNNSRNWSSTINNNQRTQTNYIKVMNRNTSSRLNSYYGLANRIALA